MKIVRASDQRAMPWKNGNGITYEAAVFPEGSSLDAFEWRVSMAQVASDGAFSAFPDIDRSLAVLTGEGIFLAVAGRPEQTIDPTSPPVSFAGELAVSARLREGPITDLNVMTRRGRWRHAITRERWEGARAAIGKRDVTLLVVAAGKLAVGPDAEPLGFRDVLILDHGEHAKLQVVAGAELLRIELSRIRGLPYRHAAQE